MAICMSAPEHTSNPDHLEALAWELLKQGICRMGKEEDGEKHRARDGSWSATGIFYENEFIGRVRMMKNKMGRRGKMYCGFSQEKRFCDAKKIGAWTPHKPKAAVNVIVAHLARQKALLDPTTVAQPHSLKEE